MNPINDYVTNFMLPTNQPTKAMQSFQPSSMDGFSTDFQTLLMQKIAMAQQMNSTLGEPHHLPMGNAAFPMRIGQQYPQQMAMPYNDAMESYSKHNTLLANPGTNSTASTLNRQPPTNQYNQLIQQAANKYGVDENLIHAIIKMESNYNPNTKSHAGAVGLMQLMPVTAETVGVTDRSDIKQNIDGGTHYFSKMLNEQGGDVKLALAAYNAGPGNVRKYGGVPPFKETQNYIQKVMDYYRA